jgi:hypothetical protein
LPPPTASSILIFVIGGGRQFYPELLFTLTVGVLTCGRGRDMNFYNGGKLAGKETREDLRCIKCDAQPLLVLKMLDPRSGNTIRMFECKCGQRTWCE